MEKPPSGLAKSSVCSSQGKQTLERIIFPLFHFNTGSSRCLSLTSDAVVVFAQVWQAAELQLLSAPLVPYKPQEVKEENLKKYSKGSSI